LGEIIYRKGHLASLPTQKMAKVESHYQPLNPDMDDGNGQKCVEAERETLPADDKATVFFLEPGECALGLESRHIHLERSASRLAGLPDPFRQLGTDASLAELLAQGFGVIAFVCRQDLRTLTRSAAFAGVDDHRV
jgi:hypothetical protein